MRTYPDSFWKQSQSSWRLPGFLSTFPSLPTKMLLLYSEYDIEYIHHSSWNQSQISWTLLFFCFPLKWFNATKKKTLRYFNILFGSNPKYLGHCQDFEALFVYFRLKCFNYSVKTLWIFPISIENFPHSTWKQFQSSWTLPGFLCTCSWLSAKKVQLYQEQVIEDFTHFSWNKSLRFWISSGFFSTSHWNASIIFGSNIIENFLDSSWKHS